MKGLTVRITESFRLEKTFKIIESNREMQRKAMEEEIECLGGTLILGSPG